MSDDFYDLSPDQMAALKRADEIMAKFEFNKLWKIDELTFIQRNGVMNMLYQMQGAEWKHFGIVIEKGRIVEGKAP